MSDIPLNEGERGASPVAVARKPIVSKRALTLGLFGLVGAVAAFSFWRSSNPPEEPIKEKLPAQLGSVVPYTPPPMVMPPKPVEPMPPPAKVAVAPPPSPAPLLMPQHDPVAQMVPTTVIPHVAPPKPYMLSFADPPATSGSHASGTVGGADAGVGNAGSTRDGVGGVTYAASHLDGVQAGLLGDQTFLLTPGLLPCIMDTAINSTFAGPIECHIPFDIKPHGVTLLDAGSVVHGFYRNNIQEGQARLFVAADWVEDKATGCFMKFDNAPISDPTGMNGVAGSVDNHYLQRFGAGILLDLGQSGMSIAEAALSKGGNTYLSFNTGGGMESVANAILQKQINIPPTITINQGTPIAVFVQKVLDFSPCYNLELKGRR